MAIDWNPELETGIDLIDTQHRSIFDQVNRLLSSMREGRGRDEVGKVIEFLGDYVVTHFAAEEQSMTELHYPDLSAHHTEHVNFIADFEKLRQQFLQEGPTILVVIAVERRVVKWLSDHIRETDRAMAVFLREKLHPVNGAS